MFNRGLAETGEFPATGEVAAPLKERLDGLVVACTRRGFLVGLVVACTRRALLVLDVIVMGDVEVEIEEKAAAEVVNGETRWSKAVVRVTGNGCDGGDDEDGGNFAFMG